MTTIFHIARLLTLSSLVLTAGYLPSLASATVYGAYGAVDIVATIQEMTAEINTEREDVKRIAVANELVALISHTNSIGLAHIDGEAIDKIAGLLDDKNTVIQMLAARALGEMGAVASRAVPALERAMEKAQPMGEPYGAFGSIRSAEDVSKAILKITGCPSLKSMAGSVHMPRLECKNR